MHAYLFRLHHLGHMVFEFRPVYPGRDLPRHISLVQYNRASSCPINKGCPTVRDPSEPDVTAGMCPYGGIRYQPLSRHIGRAESELLDQWSNPELPHIDHRRIVEPPDGVITLSDRPGALMPHPRTSVLLS